MRSTKSREYVSPIRDRKKAETRQGILRAVVRVVLEDGIHAFTVGNVAQRAGVAQRTVYRHYPTREALLEGLGELLETPDDESTDDAIDPLRSPDTAEEAIRASYRLFERYAEETKAMVVASIALRHPLDDPRTSSLEIRRSVAHHFPKLSPDEHQRVAKLMSSLAGSRMWFLLTEEEGLSSAQAAEAVTWSARALVADLARRNADAVEDPDDAPTRRGPAKAPRIWL